MRELDRQLTAGAAGKGKERAEQRGKSDERREIDFRGKDGEFPFHLMRLSSRGCRRLEKAQRTDHLRALVLPPPFFDQAISTSGRPKNCNPYASLPHLDTLLHRSSLHRPLVCLYQPVLPDKPVRKTPEELEKDDPYTMYLSRPERELKPWYTDSQMRRVEDREGRDRVADRKRERRMYVLSTHLPPSFRLSLLPVHETLTLARLLRSSTPCSSSSSPACSHRH